MGNRKIRLVASLGWVNDERDDFIDLPEGWDDWSEREQDDYVGSALDDHVANVVDCWHEVVGGDED